ncbi:nucleotidyltransferase [Ignicoccus hospitalis]|uniref:Nucleotidyltransferase-like protein n=1 Tax=Ignicoccus hospitalis (strain KIN4/I / DSM 18386 / JCM 14125) TaxID=453591 RepID=A8AAR7_IGNH4|nr:nucleotidyltransferase [Ignicoccus hospitalis]ABU82019.1 nucleotidyltransferase-like protein [Ignicoccus hospitalis KIN4/I]HIH90976.1 nucleotidyltransferase [Desulfurococcaceae archaeon]
MTFTLDDLIYVMKKLQEAGLDAVIIGGTSVELEARNKKFSGDLDLFPTNHYALVEEDFFRTIADEEGWEYGHTGLGTPKMVAKGPKNEVEIEFYDNIMDFYVPDEILNEAKTVEIKGVKIKKVSPEDYVVLKSRSEDPEAISIIRGVKALADSGKITLNVRKIKERLELFPETDVPLMKKRLKEAGIDV